MPSLRTVFFCLLVLAAPAAADQTDPRLGELFDRLKNAPAATEAAPIEAQIWTIWLETSDQEAAALLRSGMAAMERGDYQAALRDFDQIVVAAPDFAEGWNKRATVHYLLDSLKESLADIDKTLALEPRHFGALAGRGLVYLRLDDLDRALTAFEEALAVYPQAPGARIHAEAIRRLLKQREI